MDDKIANSITLHQMTIEEIREIKRNIEENIDDTVRFDIRTRLIFKRWKPYITVIKNKLEVSPRTMLLILDEVEKKERGQIDKLIDKLIDIEIANRNKLKEKKKK